MGLAFVHTRARCGVRAPEVRVEAFMAPGLPSITMVGLSGAAVRESRDRIRAALSASGFEVPGKRITLSLAPADLPKEGARFDLALAVALLAAAGQVPLEALRDVELLGELSLGGALRPVAATLPAAMAAAEAGRTLVVPFENSGEAACAGEAVVLGARTLQQVVAHLRGEALLPRAAALRHERLRAPLDLADVVGQAQGKRALEIAAAGAHALRLIGPPGCGKTLLALRLPSLMPPLAESEALELAVLRSLAAPHRDEGGWPSERPFRAPGHGASAAALVGGGSIPRPGELSLAHHGVLFLDELPEWSRQSLEALREPLESGVVHVSRSAMQAEFPARALLVTAMNPCPCGWAGDASGRCTCPLDLIARYQARVSGPLLDRIDLHLSLRRLPAGELTRGARGEDSATVRARVVDARERQQQRQGKVNAALEPSELGRHAHAVPAAMALLEQAAERLLLSARAVHRVLKVARTVADLAASPTLDVAHMAEALSFRAQGAGGAAQQATLRVPAPEDPAAHGVAAAH